MSVTTQAGFRTIQQVLVPRRGSSIKHINLFSISRRVRVLRVGAVTTPPLTGLSQEPLSKTDQFAALWDMARPINLIPSYLLVLLGAWAAGGRSLFALAHVSVWVIAGISSSIALASCVVNDYFDFTTGLDTLNAPNKPLPSGAVASELALAVGAAAYIAVLTIACLLPDPRLRFIIAASAAITLLYTPILKRISFLKNAAVAATIAAAPCAGALASGAVGGHLRVVAGPCAFLFLAVCYREILMDINDVEGDKASGVKTLPVLLGRGSAAGICIGLLVGCLLLVEGAAIQGSGLAWSWKGVPQWEAVVRGAGAAAGFSAVIRPIASMVRLWLSGFPSKTVSSAIDESLTTIGFGTILLALMA